MDEFEKLTGQVNASVEAIKKNQEILSQETKKLASDAVSEAGEAKKVSAETLKSVEKISAEISTLVGNINEIEQKIAAGVNKGKVAPRTLGELIINTDQFKDYAAGNSPRMKVEINPQANTITGQDGSPSQNSSTLVAPDRLTGIIPGAFRNLRILDVIPSGTTNSNLIDYARELSMTNSAAETGEGDAKPQSSLTFEPVSAPVRTIATFLKISNQLRDDAPAFVSYVNNRLAYMVNYRKEQQILTGNGSAQNIKGLLANGNYTGFNPTVGDTYLDSLSRMKYAVTAADFQADLVLLNPLTWGTIERLKDTTGHYLIGNPLNPYGPTLWGLPVVLSNSVPQDKAHVSSIETLAQVFNRQGTVVEIFEQDDVNVQKNLLTIRAEARLALAVYRPQSAQYGALGHPGASA